jgi:hypothetical protein
MSTRSQRSSKACYSSRVSINTIMGSNNLTKSRQKFRCGNVFILSKIKRLPMFPDATPPKRDEARYLNHDNKTPSKDHRPSPSFPHVRKYHELRCP